MTRELGVKTHELKYRYTVGSSIRICLARGHNVDITNLCHPDRTGCGPRGPGGPGPVFHARSSSTASRDGRHLSTYSICLAPCMLLACSRPSAFMAGELAGLSVRSTQANWRPVGPRAPIQADWDLVGFFPVQSSAADRACCSVIVPAADAFAHGFSYRTRKVQKCSCSMLIKKRNLPTQVSWYFLVLHWLD